MTWSTVEITKIRESQTKASLSSESEKEKERFSAELKISVENSRAVFNPMPMEFKTKLFMKCSLSLLCAMKIHQHRHWNFFRCRTDFKLPKIALRKLAIWNPRDFSWLRWSLFFFESDDPIQTKKLGIPFHRVSAYCVDLYHRDICRRRHIFIYLLIYCYFRVNVTIRVEKLKNNL